METDAAQFADAGFATAEDFEPGHFDEPEDEERLAELMMRNPFLPELDESGSSTHSNQPPTHDEIQGCLARLGEELQALVLNDDTRHLEINALRQADQVHTTRLDTQDMTLKDLQAMYANLAQDHNQTKTELAQAVMQFGDLMCYITNAGISHSAASNPMDFFTNTPGPSSNALLPRPSLNVLQPATMHQPAFDSASHLGRPIHPFPNRPVTRHMSPFSELVRIRWASQGENFMYQTGPSHMGPWGIL